jgi:hypothetical protein
VSLFFQSAASTKDVTQDSVKKGKETIGTTLMSVTDTLLDITLIPIYTFLILYTEPISYF